MHFARNGMLKHPIPYIGTDAQANLTVGSGEKRLSFRSSENKSQTVVHYSMYVAPILNIRYCETEVNRKKKRILKKESAGPLQSDFLKCSYKCIEFPKSLTAVALQILSFFFFRLRILFFFGLPRSHNREFQY